MFDTYDRNYKTLNKLWKNNNWVQYRFYKPLEAKQDTDCGQRSISYLLLCEKYKDPKLINEALK
jgi:hypothetical protein